MNHINWKVRMDFAIWKLHWMGLLDVIWFLPSLYQLNIEHDRANDSDLSDKGFVSVIITWPA